MPMRSSIRLSCGTSVFCSATPRWISSAHRTASTTLANSARAPSPVFLTMRPRWSVILGSKSFFLRAFSCASVPSSSIPIKRQEAHDIRRQNSHQSPLYVLAAQEAPPARGKLTSHIAQLWDDVRLSHLRNGHHLGVHPI